MILIYFLKKSLSSRENKEIKKAKTLKSKKKTQINLIYIQEDPPSKYAFKSKQKYCLSFVLLSILFLFTNMLLPGKKRDPTFIILEIENRFGF